jgi:hypothetical protein
LYHFSLFFSIFSYFNLLINIIAVSGNEFVKDGSWDSIHIVEVKEENATKV